MRIHDVNDNIEPFNIYKVVFMDSIAILDRTFVIIK